MSAMPKRGAVADALHGEAEQLRERAAFYEMEASYGPPPPVEEAEARAERLKRLADKLEGEAAEVLKVPPPTPSR